MIDSRAAARFAPIAIGLVLTGSAHGQALFADVTAAAGLGHGRSALLEILWPSGGFSSFIVSAGAFLEIDEANLVTGDVNADGIAGIQDLLVLLATWGPCPGPPVGCPGDLDGDGDGAVSITDLLILLTNWTAH
ncbi:MAG: hypothetical protein IID28_01850 [Planctomycetes bacterium]|nr:hypothetical protein [Planctomycetota bacterium]